MMSFAIKSTIKTFVFASTEMKVQEKAMVVRVMKGAPSGFKYFTFTPHLVFISKQEIIIDLGYSELHLSFMYREAISNV